MKYPEIFRYALIILLISFTGCKNYKQENSGTVRFGICADVHKEILHDVDLRLKTFITRMNDENVDFIIQLGDFCQPQVFNEPFVDIWNSFKGDKYHVLGNHDMDNHMDTVKFNADYTARYFGMPNRYYSFNKNGFHFIVLDGNEKTDPPKSGYPQYMGPEQLSWLKNDLTTTKLPVIVCSHQSLEWGIDNAAEVRQILEDANQKSGKNKIIACFSGHHHVDHLSVINGIYYIHINSMSYSFLGTDFIHQGRYSKRIDLRFPKIKETAPYKDPLYAIVTIDKDFTINIEGVESEWVGPSPEELGSKRYEGMVAPKISDRLLKALD